MTLPDVCPEGHENTSLIQLILHSSIKVITIECKVVQHGVTWAYCNRCRLNNKNMNVESTFH